MDADTVKTHSFLVRRFDDFWMLGFDRAELLRPLARRPVDMASADFLAAARRLALSDPRCSREVEWATFGDPTHFFIAFAGHQLVSIYTPETEAFGRLQFRTAATDALAAAAKGAVDAQLARHRSEFIRLIGVDNVFAIPARDLPDIAGHSNHGS